MADTTLLELADRCEAASGPDRGLDEAIYGALVTVRTEGPASHPHVWHSFLGKPRATDAPTPWFTASIDAALTLKPEGWRVSALTENETGWWCGLCPLGDTPDTAWSGGWGPTPNAALAVCAAALRARATQDAP